MARRQLGHGRGGRMKIETDAVEIRSGVRHGQHARQPDRAPGRQPRLRELGRADESLAGRGPEGRSARCTCRGPATPTCPGSSSTATTTSATSSSARAPARPPPGSPPARSPASSSRALGVQIRSHVTRIAGVAAPRARRARARGLRRRRREPGPLPRPGRRGGDDRGDRPPAQGEREPRRQLRGARLGPRARARLPRLLGGAARRPDRAGDGLDPVGQGRQIGAGLGGRRARRARDAHDEIFWEPRGAATTARPIAPAASRAA